MSDEIKRRIGQNLRRLRRNAKMTLAEVAWEIRIGTSTYRTWERGGFPEAVAALLRLAKLYGVSVDELLGEEDKQHDER